MLCEKCQKKQATVHLSHLVNNNVVQEVHLCQDCATQITPIGAKSTPLLPELLTSLMEPIIGKMIKEMGSVKCPHCGMTYLDFKSLGRFGCAEDYDIFKNGIGQLIEKIHGNTQHRGKIPSHISKIIIKESELLKLQRELERLVKEEKFEEAARIRDKIKEFKRNKSTVEKPSEDTK
jgi:protein arginine kinase activator